MHLVRQAVRFLTLGLTAVVLALTMGHLLEMPAKLALPPGDYVIVQQIYRGHGVVGAIVEPAAIVGVFVLALLSRGRPPFRPALLSGVCLIAALLIWVAIVNPTNAAWQTARPASIPLDFESLRLRWEWGHGARAALVMLAFASLVVAVLSDMAAEAAAAVKRTVPRATATNAAGSPPSADENAADVIEPPQRGAA